MVRTAPRRSLLAGVAATLILAGGTVAAFAAAGTFSSRRCAASHLAGAVVQVKAMDMSHMGTGMMGGQLGAMRLLARPASVPAGTVSLLVNNAGSRTHEVVVLPLSGGAVEGARAVGADGRVDETGSVGEASRSCGSGAGDGIKAGASGWVTLTLPPGRYELVCNLQNHYASGMFAELDVI
jgi:uncharacterized cupredoxin-like copper-binding protein